MTEIKEHVVLETKDLSKARTVAQAVSSEFQGRRLWLCILKTDGTHKLTVADHWGGRLSEDDAKSVLEFTAKFQKEVAKQEMS